MTVRKVRGVFFRCPGCGLREKSVGWDKKRKAYVEPSGWYRRFWCSRACKSKRRKPHERALAIPAKHTHGSGNLDMPTWMPKCYKWVRGILKKRGK